MSEERQKGPLVTQLIEGDPLQVHGRELVPLVRMTTSVRRRASLHGDSVTGQGHGFVYMKPVAILDRGEEERRHRIPSQTAHTMAWLAVVAALVPWLAMLLVYLARRVRERPAEPQSA